MTMSDTQDLYDALTGFDCATYDDIAYYTGWNDPTKVANVLQYVRRADVARTLGWVVPHVQRGASDHLYLAIDFNSPAFTPDEERILVDGGRATLKNVVSLGENEAFALQVCAKAVNPTLARKVRGAARALDGAAAMCDALIPQLPAVP